MSVADRVLLSVFVCGVAAGSAAAIPQALLHSTPAEALAAVYLDADDPDPAHTSSAERLVDMLARVRQMGLVGDSATPTRVLLDLVYCWPVVHRYPRAYILHDIHFTSRGSDSNQLDRLAMSLVLQTGSADPAVRERIQHFLSMYTNEQRGTIDTVDVLGHTLHRLVDTTAPEWATWCWGQVGEVFVISLGPGSAEQVVGALEHNNESIVGREWFVAGHQQARGAQSSLEVYLDVPGLLRRVGDNARSRLEDVLDGLAAARTAQYLWTVGADRAVFSSAFRHQEGATQLTHISDPGQYSAAHRQMVPADASRYAVVHSDAAVLLQRLASTYLALHNLGDRLRINTFWNELVKQQGIDVQRDLLDHLGDHTILHNYPPHPLGLPLMYTLLIEIKGDSAKVSRTLGHILDYCGARLDQAARDHPDRMIAPVLRKSYDGIWYVQYGVYGPALLVTSGWLAISYSPEALRANLAPAAAPATKGAEAGRSPAAP